MATNYTQSSTKPPFIKAKTGVQSDAVAVTSTADGTGTGAIPANASVVAAASGNNDRIITLPAYVAGNVIIVTVAAICELRAPVISGQPTLINGTAVDNGSAQTKELALAASTVYQCIAMGSFNWAITAIAGNGAVSAGGTPDAV
jgi:hypothetical protein|tara:strand:- start:175 stop:609 length:435 start_codon:yes stop_codon:yes gene_type:complete